MQKISNSFIIGVITKLLILLVIAKFISLVIWWFLPSDGVELQIKTNYKPAYQRVDFKNMLIGKSVVREEKKINNTPRTSSVSITSMLLKGLYGKGIKGIAIVALKSSSKKTSVISVGEIFSGYTLKSVLKDSVIFTKNGQEYTLSISTPKKSSKSVASITPATSVSETIKQVPRNIINEYIENKKDIWKDIAINPVKNGKKINGFKVDRIKNNSEIASLGLKKGDVIIAANNVKLKSLKDVLDIYKKIKQLKTVQLVVLRNGQEQELIYEIN